MVTDIEHHLFSKYLDPSFSANVSKFSQQLFRNELQKASIYFAFTLSFSSITYSWNILQLNLKKSLDLDLKKLGLPYWARITFMIYWTSIWKKIFELRYYSRYDLRCIGLGLVKTSDNLTGVGLILSYIIVLGVKETLALPYWTRFDFIIN